MPTRSHNRTILTAAFLLASGVRGYSTTDWTELLPGTGGIGSTIDTGLSAQSAVYDAGTNSMIVFGGSDASNNFATTNQVVMLTAANGLSVASAWSTLIANGAAGAPPSRAFHSAAYDAANNRMIVFGGATYANGHSNPSAYLNDVWILENANGTGGTPAWTQLNPSGSPPHSRYGQTAVYDAASNRLVIFGGSYSSTIFTDVWVLSHANGLGGTPAWSEISTQGTAPAGGYGATAVFDPADNIMTVFGGYTISSASPFGFVLFNGVWTLSHANGLGGTPRWENIVPNGAPGSPAKRDAHSAVYDSANNRMTIFAGGSLSADEAPAYNDVWVLSNANGLGGTAAWTQLRPSGVAPGRRGSHSAVYDAANNRMIVFAGSSEDAQYFSVWILTGANGL